jgi:NAD(P)H-hydrate epimerase
MKIFPVKSISELDRYTIEKEPVLSVDLMERAACQVFKWMNSHFVKGRVHLFAGPGNNGGDGLALARMLLIDDWDVTVYLLNSKELLTPDARLNYDRFVVNPCAELHILSEKNALPLISPSDLIVDALFGSGLNRPLEGNALKVVQHINRSGAQVVSIDIPSGLFGEDNKSNNPEAIIKASFTLSFQFPKLAFMFPENHDYVGEWQVLDIELHPEIINTTYTDWNYLTLDDVSHLLPQRQKFAHKGHFGHALLLSGSYGKMGAAVLASRSCLKSGVGLLTTQVPRYGYIIMQTAVPEAMVSIDRSDILISEFPDIEQFDAIGAGPGMGVKVNTCRALCLLLESAGNKPMVLDADAINILALHPEYLKLLPENTILTPHPKEFERLVGKWDNDYERLEKLVVFAKEYHLVMVLKGAFTTIALPDGTCYFNSTGNPGMASAGSGDVLTGIVLGLLAQGLSSSDAAKLGVFLHGLTGDLYAYDECEESLTANELIHYLGKAFRQLRS